MSDPAIRIEGCVLWFENGAIHIAPLDGELGRDNAAIIGCHFDAPDQWVARLIIHELPRSEPIGKRYTSIGGSDAVDSTSPESEQP